MPEFETIEQHEETARMKSRIIYPEENC